MRPSEQEALIVEAFGTDTCDVMLFFLEGVWPLATDWG